MDKKVCIKNYDNIRRNMKMIQNLKYAKNEILLKNNLEQN